MPSARIQSWAILAVVTWGTVWAGVANATPESFAPLVKKLQPAVVNVKVVVEERVSDNGPVFNFPKGSPFEEFFNNRRRQEVQKGLVMGSGFIIDPSGIIVTNNHVIENATEIKIQLKDGREYKAKLIGKDPRTDLAVLQAEVDKPLPTVQFGDSSKAEVGDWVVAIGNPLGLGGSVTAGIISARGRDINAGPYDDFIQTDAPINRGNSGGPLFNMKGEVIGINTAIYSQSGGSIGIGFAIPSNMARNVVDQIRKYGSPKRGWLGVAIQPVSQEIADSLALKSTKGALVASIQKGSPAQKAGVKNGDVILTLNGKQVASSRKLALMVAKEKAGAKVPLTVWRNNKEVTLNVVLGQLKKGQGMTANDNPNVESNKNGTNLKELGLTVRPLNKLNRAELNLPQIVKGVLISRVANNSDAQEKGLQSGMVILEMNQKPVSDIKAVVNVLDEVRKQNRQSVLLRIYIQGQYRFVVIGLKAKVAADKKVDKK